MSKPGRNDPCPCGSGKKFKKCCLGRQEAPASDPQDPTPLPPHAPPEPVDEAEEVCRRLLEEFPDLPDGFMRTAAVREARGQRRQAAEYYRKAADAQIKNDPEYGHEFAASLRAQADELDAEATRHEASRTTDPT